MFTFIETQLFTKLIGQYLNGDDYAALQPALVANPETGDLIPSSGGVRKMRWAAAGRGKCGGIRVIYYQRARQGQIWMLTVYSKTEATTIPAHVVKKIKEEIDGQA